MKIQIPGNMDDWQKEILRNLDLDANRATTAKMAMEAAEQIRAQGGWTSAYDAAHGKDWTAYTTYTMRPKPSNEEIQMEERDGVWQIKKKKSRRSSPRFSTATGFQSES